MQTAVWGSWAMHTLWRLHFIFRHGSLAGSKAKKKKIVQKILRYVFAQWVSNLIKQFDQGIYIAVHF